MLIITEEKEKLPRRSAISIEDSGFGFYGQVNNRILLAQQEKSNSVFGGKKSKSFTYTQSEVRKMIKGYREETNQTKLREISEAIYVQTPQYQRLINHYAGMPTYSYAVVPKEDILDMPKEKIKKDFSKIAKFLYNLNIKHNFTQIIRKAMIADIFFGYVYYDRKDVMMQQFPNEICAITSMESGVYNFSIKLDYFESREDTLSFYPTEVQTAYNRYKLAKKNSKNKMSVSPWYEIDSKNSICIKINEGILEPIPPFSGVFDSVYDINAFKDLRNDKAELENYKLITQKLPIRTASTENNDFLIDLPMMNYFHGAIEGVLPSNIGLATTPMELDVITFDKDTADRDGVAKATSDFWDSSGTSQNLFSSDNKTSQGINRSIESDEQVVFTILSQIQRWINRHIVLNNYGKYHNCVLIEATTFSKDTVIDRYLEGAQYGLPVRTFLSSLYGVEPISLESMTYLENEVLELPDKLIPLTSSFNTSGEELTDSGNDGRPTNEELGVEDSDETQRAEDKPDATE